MSLPQIDNNRNYVNETLTVEAGGYEAIPVGNYHATFKGLEAIETEKGEAYRWVFVIDEGEYSGKFISELSDRAMTDGNKAGRFLCALKKSKLEKGVQANPAEYVGKRYFLVVEQKPKKPDQTKITTFSMI